MLQQTHLGRPKLIGLAGCQIKSFEVAVHFIFFGGRVVVAAQDLSKQKVNTCVLIIPVAADRYYQNNGRRHTSYDPWGRARLDDAVGELEWMVQNQCSPSAGVPET